MVLDCVVVSRWKSVKSFQGYALETTGPPGRKIQSARGLAHSKTWGSSRRRWCQAHSPKSFFWSVCSSASSIASLPHLLPNEGGGFLKRGCKVLINRKPPLEGFPLPPTGNAHLAVGPVETNLHDRPFGPDNPVGFQGLESLN